MLGFILGNITGFMAGIVFMILIICHITRSSFK